MRLLQSGDRPEWLRMRLALWPRHSAEELQSEMERTLANPQRDAVFVAERSDGGLCGFAEVSLRASADGCSTSPVGYLEGWYVDADCRQQGIGAQLLAAGEAWARERGCQEMASDAYSDNTASRRAHAALGFEEVEVLAHFRKQLTCGPECDPGSDADVTPVFGLAKAQLRPIVERVAGEPVTSFNIRIDHEVMGYYGGSAEKLIPTITYETPSGQSGETTVFTKRFYAEYSGSPEARHYQHLASLGVAIPKLYGAMRDNQGREIIFVEHVDVLARQEGNRPAYSDDSFRTDPELFPKFVRMVAHFNAVRPPAEYALILKRDTDMWGDKCCADTPTVLSRVWDCSLAGQLGEALKQTCSVAPDAPAHLCQLAERLPGQVARMKLGLVHGDLFLEQIGRRWLTGDLLLFDLEDVELAPRFCDIAYWLGAPDDVERRCASLEELARLYLAAYRERGGAAPSVQSFLEETYVLWLVHSFSLVDWYLTEALDEPWERTRRDDERYRRESREQLHRHLGYLLGEIEREAL
ncbi:MAG: aminoglycoside 6'-N-acetyltransferase [Armatimonadota bacterium]